MSTLADGRDRFFARRLAIAFAVAVALHEIAAGFFHARAPEAADEPAQLQIITIAIRTPAPTPIPTIRPTPAPIVTFDARASLAQAAPAAALPVRKHRGGRAASRVVHVTPPHTIHATPQALALASAPAEGVANGGSGSGAGPGTSGDSGLGGAAGGVSGNGTGNGAGVKPCGEVWLDPIPGTLVLNRDGSRTVRIHIEVTLSDGSTAGDDLGWRFVYRREADDPFSKVGERAGTPALLQLPPRGYDLAGRQNPATVFAVQHTDAQGFTDLEDCPLPNIPPK